MESMPRSQPLHCLTFVFVQFCVIRARNFDSLTQRVAFYPAPLIISHSPKPLTFYAERELLNVHTVLNFTDLSGSFAMSNKSCSVPLEKFLDQLLLTVRDFQKVVCWLLSLPGFSTLVECDTYLPRYYQFMVGKVSRMSCPRAYKSSVSECKTWALRFCRGMSVDERQWLLGRGRTRRSNWMCHAGGLGIFRAIWTGTGHKCEENHVKKLKATLRTLSSAMSISQSMMRVINGKVVYLFKITDQMNSKLDILSQDLKILQNTFTSWQRQLKKFANSVRCHEGLTMEFLSKYTAEINRAFVAFQDTLSQISHLNDKLLVAYSDLPKFISLHLSAKLSIDPSLKLTIIALEEGLSVLAGPMVDVEHDGQFEY